MRRASAILFLLLAFTTKLFAVSDSLELLHFNNKNGLPSNNAYCVAQDRNGYIWFATENGVVKYNGYSFRIFNTSDGLPLNDVWNMYEDKSGRMFLFSNAGRLGYIENDVYHNVEMPLFDRLPNCNFFEINEHFFFQVRIKEKGYIFDFYKEKSTLVMEFEGPTFSRSGNIISVLIRNTILTYDLSNPYAGFRKKCIVEDPIFIKYSFPVELFSRKSVYYMRYRSNDNLLDVYDANQCSFIKSYARSLFKKDEYLYTAFFLQDTLLLFTNNNIYSQNILNGQFFADTLKSNIPTESQYSYRFRDNLNNYWYCTNSDGAWCAINNENVPGKEPGLNELSKFNAIGVINDTLCYFFDKKLKGFYEYNIKNDHTNKQMLLECGNIVRATRYTDSLIFLSTINGLYTYNRYTFKVKSFIDTLPSITIKFPHKTNDTILNYTARASRFYGISAISFDSNTYVISYFGFSVYKKGTSGIHATLWDNIKYSYMEYDSLDHIIWVSSKADIGMYDINKKAFYRINLSLFPWKLKNIDQLKVDSHGNIYCMINGELLIYNYANNKLKLIETHLDLSNVKLIIENNKLIIGGVFGIVVGSKSESGELIFKNVFINTNAQYYNELKEFLPAGKGKVILNTDNGAYIGGTDSLLSFNPIDDFNMVFDGKHVSHAGTDTFSIMPKTDHIKTEVVNFRGKGTPKYFYKIAGVDKDWKQNSSGEIFLNTLTPDNYYKVEGKVTDDFWESRTFTFYIYQQPFWWQTKQWRIIFWVTGIFIFLALLVSVALLTRYFVARANQKKRTLTELELRAVYAQLNPHFIFNSLSSALYFINKKRFDDAYTHVSKFSRLLRSYLKSSQDRSILLSEEIDMLRNYIELQKTRFEEKFEYSITLDNKVPAHNIRIPSLLLQPLVENAINHGLFHKGEGGVLQLQFLQGADSTVLICTIEDNGVGRLKSQELKDGSAIKQESYGTKLTNQLIEVLKEYEKMDIFLEYIDKNFPETGTIVKLTIKNISYVA